MIDQETESPEETTEPEVIPATSETPAYVPLSGVIMPDPVVESAADPELAAEPEPEVSNDLPPSEEELTDGTETNFVGENAAVEDSRGVEGPAASFPVEPVVEPAGPKKVDLDWTALHQNLSWFNQAVANEGAKLIMDTDAKVAHVLVDEWSQFKEDWNHIKLVQPTEEA